MIKRRPSLAASHGGTVTEVEAEAGKLRRINTYCRFYQHRPHKHGILCMGFLDYPACPDLKTCSKNPRPKVGEYERLLLLEG